MPTTRLRLLPAAILLALLAGLQTRAEDPPPILKKDLIRSQENLKKIGLAFHQFYHANLNFPLDLHSAEKKPLTSWRVAILPQLGEEELYKEFKLDEPWDSKHNKKLIAKIPKVYQPVRVKAKEGETFYKVFVGDGSPFTKERHRIILPAWISDGTRNTGMVFEAGEPIIWTKPGDLPFDEMKPLPKLGGMFDGEFNVCRFDGSVIHLRKDADETQLKRFIMRADGWVIDYDKLKK